MSKPSRKLANCKLFRHSKISSRAAAEILLDAEINGCGEVISADTAFALRLPATLRSWPACDFFGGSKPIWRQGFRRRAIRCCGRDGGRDGVPGWPVLCWAMRVRALLAGGAGVALVAVGAGNFAFHGPQPSWAELAHDWPIVAAGAVYAAGLARSRRRQRRSAWATAAGVFALGLAAYAAGRSGSPLCRPDSLWHYHGAWHVLFAAAAGWAARAMAPGPPVSVNRFQSPRLSISFVGQARKLPGPGHHGPVQRRRGALGCERASAATEAAHRRL